MKKELSLFLSPHPDDLVYSTFSALTDASRWRSAIVFFNVSSFTRWRFLSRPAVTLLRKLEDKLLLSFMGVRVSYRNLPDSSITQKRTGHGGGGTPVFSELYSPLGVGGNPDHLFVRDFALSIWKRMKRKTVLFFYEDLPYAARTKDLEATEKELAIEVGEICGRLEAKCLPLTKNMLWRKRLFSRLYLTQTDQSDLISSHAKKVGEECGLEYAERFFVTT